MSGEDTRVIDCMIRYGGSFVKSLAQAAQIADEENLQKIKDTWPEYWKRYSDFLIRTKTRWFTFGQCHVHSVDGMTFDKDIVVKITHEDPRSIMVKTFGQKWGHEYAEEPNMALFPRGVYEL